MRTWPGASNASLCGLPISAWRRARAAEAALAFDAYEAALKREEAAAEAYAALMRRVGPLVETGLARQLPYLPSIPGAPT